MVEEGSKDEIKGKAEEAMGRMTGDRRKGAGGKAGRAEGAGRGRREWGSGTDCGCQGSPPRP
ncbi:CsbD family protein [Streptomyces sp. NPDC093149]|uniref:CsbD family protein n=1 Tax=Streptomyces sp. NPDC093149 TaxID=3366031 RepID=UPI0037F62B05